jgi:hypothetical protein
MNAISIFCWFISFILGVCLVAYMVGDYFISYQYENAMGSYMETAKDTITPESFKEQLLLFKNAVEESGLTEEDYGALWFKKPDNSMKFQIQHVDSIIGRADAMIQWQQTSYNTSSQPIYASPESFRDVYNEKMNNLRFYIHSEGIRSDWIAKDAWYVKNHPFFYFDGSIFLLLVVLILLFGCLGGTTWED